MGSREWLLLGVVVAVLLFPVARKVWTVVRYIPPGKRISSLTHVFKDTRKSTMSFDPPPDAPAHIAALYSPGESRRVVPIDVWHEGPQLVTDILQVTDPADTSFGAALDVDGSAALIRRSEGGGYNLRIVRLDGTSVDVANEAAGSILDASIDHGRCAWWHVDPHDRRAEIRMWSTEEGVQSLGSRSYELDEIVDEPFGWLVLAGGTVVGSLITGMPGTLVAARAGLPMATVGDTNYVTVRRDVAAEWRGDARVSTSLIGPETDHADQLSSLDLSHFPPTVTPVRRGLMVPGGTVANGEAVVQWRRSFILELPGGLSVPLSGGSYIGVDPLSDGEFAALALSKVEPKRNETWGVLLHLPTGARETLARDLIGTVHIRGEHVMWSQAMARPAKLWSSEMPPVLTQVGRLRRPSARRPSS